MASLLGNSFYTASSMSIVSEFLWKEGKYLFFLFSDLDQKQPFGLTCLTTIPDESESKSHSVLSYSVRPHGPQSPWASPGQNTGVGRLSLLQGIFPTQGWNSGLLHCRWILYHLSHQGSPVSGSHSILSDSLRPHVLYSPWNSPGQNTGVGRLSLLQEIFPTQVSCIAGRFFTS